MSPVSRVRSSFVDFIPDRLETGVLYISRRYATATHLCCCGCGLEVVTPLNPAKWRLDERDGTVSLTPSIGNWSFPCKSHYWIIGNEVRWAAAMAPALIAAVKACDRRDVVELGRQPVGLAHAITRRAQELWAKTRRWLERWLR